MSVKREMKVTLQEWLDILRKMRLYNRTEGYVDTVEGKLAFFDTDPKLDGVSAFHVTEQRVSEIVEAYLG